MLVPSNRTHTQELPVTTLLSRWFWAVAASFALTLAIATPAAAAKMTKLDLKVPSENACGAGFVYDGIDYAMYGTWTTHTSSSGNVSFTCRGELEGPLPAHSIAMSNPDVSFPCWDAENAQFIQTTDWVMHFTPSGNGTYRCQYKAN
jgi:hypothetical protein